MTFEELYKKITSMSAENKTIDLNNISADKNHLSCLLHPEEHSLVWKIKDCDCTKPKCVSACLFDAIEIKDRTISFNAEKCVGCAECVKACDGQNLVMSTDIIKVIEALKDKNKEVYALMAPAFVGQFGKNATPSKIRSALYEIGFHGMVEVAAFADILTLKESLEFVNNAKEDKFQLTSCCCPVWIAMIRHSFKNIVGHLPPAVSPMIAAGRIAKALHKDAYTVFVGPCIAKKAEAREPDLVGAIDAVLTFQELQDIFNAFKCDFNNVPNTIKEHSSTAGRLYARGGGVSKAVKLSVQRLNKHVKLKPVYADGVADCKEMLSKILNNELDGNFYEGMACKGGCVGGPKRIIDTVDATNRVNSYADEALYGSPIDNPYVIELIKRLGFNTIDEFIHNSDILNRTF